MKVINNLSALLSVLVGTAILFNSCGDEKSNREEESGKAVPPVITQPRPPEKSTTSTPTQPTSENPENQPAGSEAASPSGTTEPKTALYPMIEVGEYTQTSLDQKYDLLTKENLRCRVQGAAILHPDSEKSVPQTAQLEGSYRYKHYFPNFFDSCRQKLGLTGSFGSNMKLEALVSLEACTRNRKISQSTDAAARHDASLELMLEQLSMLCQLENSRLTPEVQTALSAAFIETWTSLE